MNIKYTDVLSNPSQNIHNGLNLYEKRWLPLSLRNSNDSQWDLHEPVKEIYRFVKKYQCNF